MSVYFELKHSSKRPYQVGAKVNNKHLPKSNNVHELGFESPVATFPYSFSARSFIFDLHQNINKYCSTQKPRTLHLILWLRLTESTGLVFHLNLAGKNSNTWYRSYYSYPIASIWGRENAVVIIKKRVQYTRGFTKRTLISSAFTSLATLATFTATAYSRKLSIIRYTVNHAINWYDRLHAYINQQTR